MRRWIHAEKGRYYQVELVQDLFGDWNLVQCWGGVGSKRGAMRVVWVHSHAAGLERIEMIGTRRGKRGYAPVG